MKKIKIIPSDLSLRDSPEFDQDIDLEFELELGLLGVKLNMGSWTFPPSHLNRVKSGRQGKTLLISFMMVLIYSIESSRDFHAGDVHFREWQDSPSSLEAATVPSLDLSLSLPLEDISARPRAKNR